MTIQEFYDWCVENNIPLDTQMAISSMDGYLVVEERIRLDSQPYFGNCEFGTEWENKNLPRDKNGDIDFDSAERKDFLIFDIY